MSKTSGKKAPSASYAAAGVDVEAASKVKERIRAISLPTLGPQVVHGPGLFGGAYRLQGFKDPVLVSSTDGVGTKLRVAALAGRYDTVGLDSVAQNVNDVVAMGARPLFFLDYIAMGSLVPSRVEAIVKGVAQGCLATGCALIGGETAEMPGVYHGDDFELIGFVVGAAERDAMLDGSSIQEGDLLLGLASSGPHTNGYSLVRHVFRLEDDPLQLNKVHAELGRTLGEALLEPHRSYYPLVEPVVPLIRGMAHITGGGLEGNVPRIVPKGLAAEVRKGAWEIPPLFRLVQRQGQVAEDEMYRVFNMGIGMVLVCSPTKADAVRAALPEVKAIGQIVKQSDNRRFVFV